jgi:hypothetical protein
MFGTGKSDTRTVTVTRAQKRFTSWMRDVLVYTTVLNLFVEFADAIVIDSFTISIFTAVVLKVMLDLLTSVEHRVKEFVGRFSKLLGFVSMWLVLFLSKFVILEVIDIIFGDHVELGKFLDVVVLIVTMMIVRELATQAYLSLGAPADPESSEGSDSPDAPRTT